jgi:hypothetical protein
MCESRNWTEDYLPWDRNVHRLVVVVDEKDIFRFEVGVNQV